MLRAAMNKAQRITIVVYCLLLAYCCLWIPWRVQIHVPSDSYRPTGYYRVGYGWSWDGPKDPAANPYRSSNATPDLPLIELRFIAVTAITAAALLVARLREKP